MYPLSVILNNRYNRTKISDPAFVGAKEIKAIDAIPTKEYAQPIFQNITDVRVFSSVLSGRTFM